MARTNIKLNKTHSDYILLSLTAVLLFFGLAVLYSASTVQSYKSYGNTTHYIFHQIVFGGLIGVIGMYITSRIDYHVWIKYLAPLLFLSFLLLALVKVPGIGSSSGGASRWVHIGPVLFQSSEFAKLVIVFYLAAWADKKRVAINNLHFGLLPSLCIIGLFSALIIWEPDLGTMLVLVATAAIMLFVAGLNWKYMFYTAVCSALLLFAFIKVEPYRARRITTFFDPTNDPKGISYQINQAILAIGAGGIWGYGYGLSRQKAGYLPETINDSIFAVLAEELGFIRVVALLVLFALFFLRGMKIAKNAPDTTGKMIAVGITSWIVVQALINIGAMVNLLPLTGIPLPFFSYGSTSLIMILSSIGILLNISKQANLENV